MRRFNKETGILILLVSIYKVILELGFYRILTIYTTFYQYEFDLRKYINGILWCLILLAFINYDEKKVSSFFVFFIYIFQIIPITIVYAMMKGCNSPIYYNCLCTGYLILELLVFYGKPKRLIQRNQYVSKLIVPLSIPLVMAVLFEVYRKNGVPTLIALNVYNVYTLRSSGLFQIGKYFGYLVRIVATAVIPILLSLSILERKWSRLLFCIGSQLLIYLYTGHKTYLFAIILTGVVSFWVKREKFFWEFSCAICLGFSLLTVVMLLKKTPQGLIWDFYSLFIRRTLIVPAGLKFIHYDYFLKHPFLGMYGALPRVLVLIKPQYYLDLSYAHDIGALYFNDPNMSADTGVFAEGFSRFGYLGIFILFVLLAMIIRQIENLQNRTGYSVAIGFFIYPIYALSEQQLVGSFVAGTWMFLLAILWFYREIPEEKYKNKMRF